MISSRQRANAIRALAMDAVQQAKSGHPGAPLGMADIAETLWTGFLRHNPANPKWSNRDRFVLSNGHGSMLIYALLHLTGYDLPMSELEKFRQLGSRTPGHPEFGHTPGVETTTGPLGQGLANAVGLAIAEKLLAAHFNRTLNDQDFQIVDHCTYTFVGDGCLMEGISHEVASLAGTLGLGKLICLYDDNGISIDGDVKDWFTDDTPARFRAYGWQVIDRVDGHDGQAVAAALEIARNESAKPTLICCQTTIGYGAPTKAGTAASHGAPLGAEEISGARAALDWSHPPFVVPDEIAQSWDARDRGAALEASWEALFRGYQQHFPELAAEFNRRHGGDLPAQWPAAMDALLETTDSLGENLASRQASAKVIAHMAELLPELVGGSADLTGSNLTNWPTMQPVSAEQPDGNYIYYGVREFGMTAIANGLALHGGILPFTGTFLVFMDYAKNAVRMAALMGLRNVLVYTHDSIGQGEDGPTHQPIEHLASLRGMPNMSVWRPADGVETVVAWRGAVERQGGPTALVLSRQSLPHQARSAAQIADIKRGAYVLCDSAEPAQIIIIATGSEVSIAVQAFAALAKQGVAARVVSMPSADVFEAQDQAYRDSVLPPANRHRLAVESAHVDYWWKWVGLDGRVIGMTSFGESGPGGEVLKHFGFTAENIVDVARSMI
ncbi:transketolase [Pseudomonadales bacterium]|nr:transketolase [Pseudomonadales bacterium]MDB9867187.1 transketolase [Pseudomonadales bacterium]MDB9917309.1 transketolase [Pseudomonadales bacterium]MDC0174635.1 transketolase [Pseudomonadales bacterium]MDC1307130.1 transketolase [Pseudomonadales bacterium]